MCEARNEHGVANTWAEVLVESKPFSRPPLLSSVPALPLAASAAWLPPGSGYILPGGSGGVRKFDEHGFLASEQFRLMPTVAAR